MPNPSVTIWREELNAKNNYEQKIKKDVKHFYLYYDNTETEFA